MWLKPIHIYHLAVSGGRESAHSILGPLPRASHVCNYGICQATFISVTGGPLPNSLVLGNIQFLRSLATCWMSSECHSQLSEAICTSMPCGLLHWPVTTRQLASSGLPGESGTPICEALQHNISTGGTSYHLSQILFATRRKSQLPPTAQG